MLIKFKINLLLKKISLKKKKKNLHISFTLVAFEAESLRLHNVQLHHKMALAEVNRACGTTEGGFSCDNVKNDYITFFLLSHT